MFDDLIEFKDVLDASEEMFAFENVTFLRDFGPYKTGDKVGSLWFIISEGKAESLNVAGVLENTWKFKIVTA